jgi:hypothetical protein
MFRLYLGNFEFLNYMSKETIPGMRSQYCIVTNLVSVTCFLPGRAKDLSASPRIIFFSFTIYNNEAFKVYRHHHVLHRTF